MEFGEFEPFLRRKVSAPKYAGGGPSAILDSKPDVRADLMPVWRAFVELSATRAVGMAPNAIRPESVAAWLDLHGVTDPAVRLELWEFVVEMDQAWLSWAAKKRKGGASGDSAAAD